MGFPGFRGNVSPPGVASFADQAVDPLHVAKAPSAAISKALSAARMSTVHFYEIHETFGAVTW